MSKKIIEDKDYDVVVIGSGLGGLTAASMLSQNGYKVLVLEKHNLPGGYATNFYRKGFTFDVSLHSFDGVLEGRPSYEVIKKAGVSDKVTFLKQPILYDFNSGDISLRVEAYDVEGYIKKLVEMFPEEANNLVELFKEAGKNFDEMANFFYKKRPFWFRYICVPFIYRRLLKYEKITVDEFFSRYTKNALLKKILSAQWSYYGLPAEQLAFGYFSYPFIDYLRNGGYSVKGGSLELSKAMVEVIRENGGEVLISSPVTKILVDNKKRICGVESRLTGRIDVKKVISNIPPKAIVSLMDENVFSNKFLDNLNSLKTSVSGFQVYLGLDCTLESLGIEKDIYIKFHSPQVPQADQYENINSGNIMSGVTGWSFNFFSNIDDTIVPEGKSSLGIFTLIGKDQWQTLPKLEYRKKKRELTDYLIAQATAELPGLKDHIEVCEAGSPRTLKNFTWNPEGSIYGFEQTVKQSGLKHRFQQKYPIKGLYQSGAWTFPGAGFIGTMLSAQTLVDRYFRKNFRSRK